MAPSTGLWLSAPGILIAVARVNSLRCKRRGVRIDRYLFEVLGLRASGANLKMDHRQPFAAVFGSELSTPDAHALAKL